MICDGKARIDIRRLRCGNTDAITVCGITLPVVRTPCHLGGTRNWFLCRQCERRCALLYGDGYLCRICVKGRYLSELASPRKRKVLKAFRTRDRLGQTGWEGLLVPSPGKPKHMHWSTYLKIRAAAEQRRRTPTSPGVPPIMPRAARVSPRSRNDWEWLLQQLPSLPACGGRR